MKIAVKQFDFCGGLCNRIFAWECIYEIAKINNANIVCDWKELEFLDLPNTTYETNFNNYLPFNSNNAQLVKNNFLFDPKNNYMAICGFDFNRIFEETHYREKKSPKQQIKLKDCVLEKKIEEITKDVVGVHIRRGDYKNIEKFTTRARFRTPDQWYLNLMNQYKEKFDNIKFYISSDAEKSMLKIFYDNFDIIDCDYILGKKTDKNMMLGPKLSCNYEDVVDLIALGKTKEIICSVSTWSMFAYEANNKPYIWPETEDQKLSSIKYWK